MTAAPERSRAEPVGTGTTAAATRGAPDEATAAPDEVCAALALALLPGVGPVTARRLRDAAGSFDAAFVAASAGAGTTLDDRVVDDALRRAGAIQMRATALGIACLPYGSAGYPSSLDALEDPPVVLFAHGDRALATRAAVALVGSRDCTPYGRRVVREIARRLAGHGVVVVSGLATGIDAEAHAATLAARGGTIAVLGTGVDVAYPASNEQLQRQVARDGLLLSELFPGRRAHAGAFPRRNRLIAALADVVVVVEAGVRSGALITAQVGNAIGRIVAAVPGPIDEAQSAGANRLLRDGAQVIASVDDVVGLVLLTARGRAACAGQAAPPAERELPPAVSSSGRLPPAAGWPAPASVLAIPPTLDGLSPEARVLAVLAQGARTPDELVRACEVSPREVGIALATLSVQGIVVIDGTGLAHRIDAGSWLSG